MPPRGNAKPYLSAPEKKVNRQRGKIFLRTHFGAPHIAARSLGFRKYHVRETFVAAGAPTRFPPAAHSAGCPRLLRAFSAAGASAGATPRALALPPPPRAAHAGATSATARRAKKRREPPEGTQTTRSPYLQRAPRAARGPSRDQAPERRHRTGKRSLQPATPRTSTSRASRHPPRPTRPAAAMHLSHPSGLYTRPHSRSSRTPFRRPAGVNSRARAAWVWPRVALRRRVRSQRARSM